MQSGRLRARRLLPGDRAAALALLLPFRDQNLCLIDLVERLADPADRLEPPPQVHGAFDGERLVGLASLRPSLALSHGIDEDTLACLVPALRRISSGLLKGERRAVDLLWPRLAESGCEAILSRIEIAYRIENPIENRGESLGGAVGQLPEPALPGVARAARAGDLAALVHAARASLWEEQRPDPAERDPVGFARWVESRLSRARVVCEQGRVVFVAYADVRSRHGWLVQGVYTWPEARRRGFARHGMATLVAEAFAAGAAHVQLAVVAGNERASRLYCKLGFEPFAELRTVLFH